MPLRVHYNRPVAWLCLLLGLVNFVLGLLAPGPVINVVLGVLFIVLGAVFFTRTYFTYTPRTRTLEVIAPIGTRRSFTGSGENGLIVEGGRFVLVRPSGKHKKLPVSRWMSRADEWDAVIAAVGQAPKAT
jgi:hypothetical protein